MFPSGTRNTDSVNRKLYPSESAQYNVKRLRIAMTATQTFYVAPFAFNGESQGIGAWQISALSNRWLDFGRDVLRAGGASFSSLLPTPFERVGLRFTSARGAALATFSLDGAVV